MLYLYQKSEKSCPSGSCIRNSNVLGNTLKVFLRSNVFKDCGKFRDHGVTRIHNAVTTKQWKRQEYSTRLICKICEQQEVNSNEKVNHSWPTGQENESEEQPDRNDKEEFGNSWGVNEKN